MITLITGAPGSGKSAALVDLLNSIAKSGRAVYADGVPDLKIPHITLDDPRRWPELVPDGAAVVIDEVQRVWRPAGPGAKVASDIEALETHRHRGLDFFLVTQHPNLLHQNVRRLVGRHVHLRDVGMLGRWWYEWPEATDPATFRSAPVKKRYRLPKAAFSLYKSASVHIKPIRSFPMALVVLVVALLAGVGLAARAYSSVSAKLDPAKPAPAAHLLDPQEKRAPTGTAQPAQAVQAVAQVVESPPVAVGCMASPQRCICYDAEGRPIRVEWQLCQDSARGFGGIVPLSLKTIDAPRQTVAASMSLPASSPQPSIAGFGAGDFRQRQQVTQWQTPPREAVSVLR